jgi:septum formation protein
MPDPSRLVLASGSPRRQSLLGQLGIPLLVAPPRVDESDLPGELPRAFVARVARKKGLAVVSAHPGAVVLAADTAVVLGDRLFGKPRDAADALRMLRLLSGQRHEVVTGVFAAGPGGAHEAVVATSVCFRQISEAEARWYVGTGEPMDKAGAYAIQDRGGIFVAAIEGSYSNVVGLPLAESLSLLERAGLVLPWEVKP